MHCVLPHSQTNDVEVATCKPAGFRPARRRTRARILSAFTLPNAARSFIRLVGIVLLALMPLGSVTGSGGALRVQPALWQIAATQPTSAVTVIVQMVPGTDGTAARIDGLGGTVIHDLSIIHALGVTLPGRALPALAALPGVRWISADAAVRQSDYCEPCISTRNLLNTYDRTIGADRLWNEAPYVQGQGVTVAVLDSGVANHDDFEIGADGHNHSRLIATVETNSSTHNANDKYGHRTHVAGIIGGNGSAADGMYIGIAPRVNLVSVKVMDDRGEGTTSDVVAGLQWVLEHKDIYNIRVVNLSLNSSLAESYHTSPLDAALEILWFNRIVVVVSAGNNGDNGILYPPANDPFVITVGALDEHGTAQTSDDTVASFSASGITMDRFAKPDLVAPGKDLISTLSGASAYIYKQHPSNRVPRQGPDRYFRMSGTSMSAPVVSGAAALLLQTEPSLTPDQVKFQLTATAHALGSAAGAGSLDVYSAIHTPTSESANTGTAASQLLWSGPDPVNWSSVNWNSVNWNSDYWGN